MSYKFEREGKFYVLNLIEVGKYLSEEDKHELGRISYKIANCRQRDDKKRYNDYVIVNEDEEYSPIIWKLIEMGERLKHSTQQP